jgi:dTDP-4-dehydrorhamnose 3,5-epimerase
MAPGWGRCLRPPAAILLYVPAGFVHGFCVLSDAAAVLYKVTQEYAPALERGIIWNDPEIDIRWPLSEPILSDKDAQLPLLRDADLVGVNHYRRCLQQ